MPIPLARLIADITGAQARGDLSMPIAAIATDSRRVTPGSLFIAIPGFQVDGHRFIADAIARGAVAVLGQHGYLDNALATTSLPDNFPVVSVPDSRAAEADVAAAFFGFPARSLRIAGVTGTDGKTTTTMLLASIFDAAGLRTGVLNTVLTKIGDTTQPNDSHQTTPPALEVQRTLRAMADAGVGWAVLECSSHGLALDRLRHCYFDSAVLTNVTGDHLDFHGSFEEYRRAKERLFRMLWQKASPQKPGPKTAIVNADDPSAPHFIAAASGAEVWTYGLAAPTRAKEAEPRVTARDIQDLEWGTQFLLSSESGTVPVRLSVPGRFNVSNALAAATAALSQGIALEAVRDGLEGFTGVPGRMECLQSTPFLAVVDYAHTPHALSTALATLRAKARGRVIAVFGSMGGRERPRRAGLGQAAARGADYIVLTTDDPGNEDPLAIIHEIAEALEAAGRRRDHDYTIVPDRREAIRWAVAHARPGDAVLIAGMGAETSMLVGDGTVPWDDREVTREALQELAR